MTTPTLNTVVDGDVTNKPAIVLGASLGTTTHAWDAAVPLLTDRFAVVRFDLPGHGESPVAPGAFTLADLADAVIALADSLGVDTFDYAGVSVCGALALELAHRYPDRVRHAAAVCTSAYFGGVAPNAARADLVRRERSASQVAGLAERWFSAESRAMKPELVAQFERMVADTPTEGYAQVVDALGTYDARPHLADIRVPVLVISGDEDPGTTPAAGAEVVAGVPGARQIVIAQGSHQAAAEHPEQVAQVLVDFFSGN